MCAPSGKKERMAQIFEDMEAEKAAGPANTGASQTATSGSAAQPAGQPGQSVVVKGAAGANYAGRGATAVRNNVRDEEEYSDIALKRKRRSASNSIGL